MPLHHSAHAMKDPWSCSLLALPSLWCQRSSQTPGLAATMRFSAEEESRRLSFPGFPLGNLNPALIFQSRKLCVTRSTIWLMLLSPVMPGEGCWASRCEILPPGSLHLSVPTVVSALCWLPSASGHSVFFWEWRIGKDHQGYKICSAVTAGVCAAHFMCRWHLVGSLARIIQLVLLINTTWPFLSWNTLTLQRLQVPWISFAVSMWACRTAYWVTGMYLEHMF